MVEQRKEIPGYEGRYWISNLGRIKSRFQELKTERNKMGYHRIRLYGSGGRFDKKTFQIHRLVYCVFNSIPINFDGKNLVCHKDNDINNNILDNLYLGSQKDNMRQASRDGRIVVPRLKGELNCNSKQTEKDVRIIKRLLHKGVQQNIIAYAFNLSKSTINAIHKGRMWNHVSR